MSTIREVETGKRRIVCDECGVMAPDDGTLLRNGGLINMGWTCEGGKHVCPGHACRPVPLSGTVMPDGSVIDWAGEAQSTAAFIPDNINDEVKAALGLRGWVKTPASDWPSMMPVTGTIHIHRKVSI